MEALEAELKKDRSPARIMAGGSSTLVILTRKRTRQSLERVIVPVMPILRWWWNDQVSRYNLL